MTLKEIDKIPGLRELLDKCQEDIQALTNIPVSVYYRIKFHHLSTSALAEIICDVCEVEYGELTSNIRKAQFVIARHLFCYFSATVQKKSLPQIARILNAKDHTMVLHARDKIIAMKETNDELYMTYYHEVERRINQLMIQVPINQPA